MPSEKITFPGHSGAHLSARLDLPSGPHLATALFAHCFTCGKDLPAARRIARRLAAMGVAVMRFDFTGLGQSEGSFGDTTFCSNVGDLKAAAKYLESRGMAPGLLIGHSLGGAAVLRAAPEIASAKAVVTIGAPAEPAHVTDHFSGSLDQIETEGSAQVDLGGAPVTISQAFVDDVRAQDLEGAIQSLRQALLVLHAPGDRIVGIDNAAQIFTAARHPKSFVTLDDADHLLTRAEDADYAAGVIAAWAQRYLAMTPPAPPPGVPEDVLRVAEADPEGFLQDIQSGPHHLTADEPVAYGGTNRGLSPYGLISAGLGACTSMTIRMYARRKGWALSHVCVDVTHEKVHAQDAGQADGPKIDQFHRRITLTGDLSDDQRQRLREIADKCPVHKTLEMGTRVSTELA
jgi:putative redox protein